MLRVGEKYQVLGEARKVIEWKFYRRHLPDGNENGQSIYLVFEVKMICPSRNAWSEGQRIRFVAEATDGPTKYRLDGDDLYDLYDQAEAIAEGVKSIQWKPMLHVKTRSSDRPYSSAKGADISIGYSLIELGTRGKQKCWRKQGDKNPRSINEDWPETGKDDDGGMSSIIDDTPQHRAKLDALLVGIENISSRISDLMSPKRIVDTLANLNTSKLLPNFGD